MKLGYWIVTIYITIILLFNLCLNNRVANVGNYSSLRYEIYKMRIWIRSIKSTLLAEHIYKQIKYFKKQQKPEPKVLKQPFSNRC